MKAETHRIRLKVGGSFVLDYSTPDLTEAECLYVTHELSWAEAVVTFPHQDARLTWSRNGILDRHRQHAGVAL